MFQVDHAFHQVDHAFHQVDHAFHKLNVKSLATSNEIRCVRYSWPPSSSKAIDPIKEST